MTKFSEFKNYNLGRFYKECISRIFGIQIFKSIRNTAIIHENLTHHFIARLQENNALHNLSVNDIKKFLRCLSKIEHFQYGNNTGL